MAKRKTTTLRFRKNDPGHNVLAAVSRWVKANGGSTVVIGGIGIMPGDRKFVYYVMVQCMGNEPIRKNEDKTVRKNIGEAKKNVVKANTAA